MGDLLVVVDHGPFAGLHDHDLSCRALSVAEKRWLGEQQMSNLVSAQELADRYNLKVGTVRRYALRLSKGQAFAGVPGRPQGSKDKCARKRRPKRRAYPAAPEEVKEDSDAGVQLDFDDVLGAPSRRSHPNH